MLTTVRTGSKHVTHETQHGLSPVRRINILRSPQSERKLVLRLARAEHHSLGKRVSRLPLYLFPVTIYLSNTNVHRQQSIQHPTVRNRTHGLRRHHELDESLQAAGEYQ
jgi:hypothetical protein